MGPIEVMWGVLIVVFGCIGVIRGFLKELGVTLSILVAMYIMAEFLERQEFLDKALFYARRYPVPIVSDLLTVPTSVNLLKLGIYGSILFSVVFISYHGQTLDYPGQPPKGAAGFSLNLLAGLVNGYLITGTLWHYLDVLDYPIQIFGMYQPPLSKVGKILLEFTLIRLFPPYVMLFFIFFLILARVYR